MSGTIKFRFENALVSITFNSISLDGQLTLPEQAKGIVIFAHGSGSSRFSPRNQCVAADLAQAGFATLLFDLLTDQEEKAERLTRHLRFDIDLLSERLRGTTDWVRRHPDLRDLPIGYFGASTGAAAALVAAAAEPGVVKAVVSRGGRPDLAGKALGYVKAPTLLLVGGLDYSVIVLNQQAFQSLPPDTEKQLLVVPGASHLFEEPGKLEEVSEYAQSWFLKYLGSPVETTPVSERDKSL